MEVFVVGAKRTPIGKFGGIFKNVPATELAKLASKAAIDQAGLEPSQIDEAIFGNVLMAGEGMGPARQVSIGVGMPVEVPAYTVNMVCGSGMKSLMLGAQDIASGEARIVLTGGMENMSQAPYLLPYKARFGMKFGDVRLVDSMIHDGLMDVFNNVHMGLTAEYLAEKFGISREEQDEFAYWSQMKTKKAMEKGKFEEEIVPVKVKMKGEEVEVSRDEHPRPDVTLEKLAALKPAFKEGGTVTAGNSSGINDGASAIVLASGKMVENLGLKPLARVVAWAQAGVDPMEMGLGPVPAVKKLLEKTNLMFSDIDLIELNEAFAAQSIAVMREWSRIFGVDEGRIQERLNVNGGAIALGHPIGATGNRIIVTLLYELKRQRLEWGIATLCIGGGMGTAVLIQNVE